MLVFQKANTTSFDPSQYLLYELEYIQGKIARLWQKHESIKQSVEPESQFISGQKCHKAQRALPSD